VSPATKQRTGAAATALVIAALLLPLMATTAGAACAADPDALSFRQMIAQGRTGVDGFPIMFLGKVVRTKDLGGGPGGATIAKLAVAAHPVGYAPLVSRSVSGARRRGSAPRTRSSSTPAPGTW
jgi:hypothetical protein